jgi:3-deoxy-D-manno-octulosonate 8-phosphate phosphatase (KDO 8-P phosphatase)
VKTLQDLPEDLRERLRRVRLLLLDVDGVLTNGLIYLDDHGVETKRFSTRDGLAVWWVRKFGLLTGVISGRPSPATELRCRDLGMDEVHTAQPRKLPVFEEIMARRGIAAGEIAYIGDDVVDLPVLKRVGVSAAPSDAHPEVLKQVDLALDHPGGGGAVRQFVELWLMAAGHWESAMEDMIRGNI